MRYSPWGCKESDMTEHASTPVERKKVKLLSPVRLFATPWTGAHQAPLSVEFPSKKTGVGCHFLLQEIFPTQRSNPRLLHPLHWQADSLPLRYLEAGLRRSPREGNGNSL